MKTFLTVAAVMTLTAIGPALAQENTPAPRPNDQMAPAVNPAAPNPAAPTTPPAVDAAPGGFVAQQSPGQILTTDVLKKSVFNGANENLGNVNDFLVSEDGKVEALIVGVGGFLGIGEKNVAVPVTQVKFTATDNGTAKLTVDTTKDALKSAPEFQTLRQSKQANAGAVNNGAMTPATTPAPRAQP